MSKRICVIVPTLNEAGTIRQLCTSIFENVPAATILIVDDNSTDGTIDEIEDLVKSGAQIDLVIRPKRLGIGSAHQVGLELAASNGFDIVVTMDADLSHSPEDINRLLEALNEAEVVIGSRFLPGGGLENWSLYRRSLTYLGHFLTCVILRVNYDASTAFRAYRLSPKIVEIVTRTPSHSYAFFVESISLLNAYDIQISQVAVVLPSRTYGHSKMRVSDLFDSVRRLILTRKLLRNVETLR